MNQNEARRREVLDELGLSKMPDPRREVPDEQPPISGSGLLNYKKALQTVDVLESAAMEKYIPMDVVIDQGLDARIFHPELTKAIMFRTDVPIPSNDMVLRATGIGAEQTPENQRRWLGMEVKRHFQEFGCKAISAPLVFRWNAGSPPVMGCIVKIDPRPRHEGAGANWALLGEKRATTIVAEDENEERLFGLK